MPSATWRRRVKRFGCIGRSANSVVVAGLRFELSCTAYETVEAPLLKPAMWWRTPVMLRTCAACKAALHPCAIPVIGALGQSRTVTARCAPRSERGGFACSPTRACVAESEGFEPSCPEGPSVFKTAPINPSGSSPISSGVTTRFRPEDPRVHSARCMPIHHGHHKLVRAEGVEPSASGAQDRRSAQLSYALLLLVLGE